jgi:hypothetical protein
MVVENVYCKKCGQYTDNKKWCKMCQRNYLKKISTNWISENELIDNLIQEMHLRVDSWEDIIFEWIQYSQFNDIKKLGKSGLCSAIWNDGPLYYDDSNDEYYARNKSTKVTLKYLYNSQNITHEMLNEV